MHYQCREVAVLVARLKRELVVVNYVPESDARCSCRASVHSSETSGKGGGRPHIVATYVLAVNSKVRLSAYTSAKNDVLVLQST